MFTAKLLKSTAFVGRLAKISFFFFASIVTEWIWTTVIGQSTLPSNSAYQWKRSLAVYRLRSSWRLAVTDKLLKHSLDVNWVTQLGSIRISFTLAEGGCVPIPLTKKWSKSRSFCQFTSQWTTVIHFCPRCRLRHHRVSFVLMTADGAGMIGRIQGAALARHKDKLIKPRALFSTSAPFLEW